MDLWGEGRHKGQYEPMWNHRRKNGHGKRRQVVGLLFGMDMV